MIRHNIGHSNVYVHCFEVQNWQYHSSCIWIFLCSLTCHYKLNSHICLNWTIKVSVKWVMEFLSERYKIISTVHRGAFCQFPFWWIYYYGSNKSTGKETGETHLCAVYIKHRSNQTKHYHLQLQANPLKNVQKNFSIYGRNRIVPWHFFKILGWGFWGHWGRMMFEIEFWSSFTKIFSWVWKFGC